MEQKSFELIDDMDGVSRATETVRFGLDRVDYEIDLTDAHAMELRDLMRIWAMYGRRVRPASSGAKPRRSARITSIAPSRP
ncbi:Lsr2 dimerization domain-containing protein [Nocardia vaccinii]|uniref:Lsr2 dimerization domain-containing protein n=1 Tax=Nocardia vaccinii TaxID=1822 RepID=UPI0012F4F386|nr:histone-like nucleoid-structuring protein Lsr2 [Nocardia vaccinii]